MTSTQEGVLLILLKVARVHKIQGFMHLGRARGAHLVISLEGLSPQRQGGTIALNGENLRAERRSPRISDWVDPLGEPVTTAGAGASVQAFPMGGVVCLTEAGPFVSL